MPFRKTIITTSIDTKALNYHHHHSSSVKMYNLMVLNKCNSHSKSLTIVYSIYVLRVIRTGHFTKFWHFQRCVVNFCFVFIQSNRRLNERTCDFFHKQQFAPRNWRIIVLRTNKQLSIHSAIAYTYKHYISFVTIYLQILFSLLRIFFSLSLRFTIFRQNEKQKNGEKLSRMY